MHSAAGRLLWRINEHRKGNGLHELHLHVDESKAAESHSWHLFHNQHLLNDRKTAHSSKGLRKDWSENVGHFHMIGRVSKPHSDFFLDQIFEGFRGHKEHNDNMLDPNATHIAVGVAEHNDPGQKIVIATVRAKKL